MKIVKHDDGNLIWFNYNDIDWDVIDNLQISHFDVEDVPTKMECHNFLHIYEPVVIDNNLDKLTNYYVTYFEDRKSKTGYSCMLVNKNKEVYKSHAGYKKVDNNWIPNI